MRFIIPRGKSEVTVTDALHTAYDQSREAGLGPVWVQEEEILKITPTKTVSRSCLILLLLTKIFKFRMFL